MGIKMSNFTPRQHVISLVTVVEDISLLRERL
uniref:Uncharacterized protein n=1 Tax=Lepeophtheirus salmonis TaxID=72036 RepID=A0A0K2SY19_LEPSM